MICQALATLVAAVSIGFFFNWRMSLVALVLMPLVGVTAVFASGLYSGQVRQDGEVAESTGKVAIEVVNAMRTVASLHKEHFFMNRFATTLDKHLK